MITGWLVAAHVSPNAISIFGMFAAIAGGVAFSLTGCECVTDRLLWIGGAALVFVRLLANMFDGMVAVESGKTSRVGELFNEVPDRISNAVVLIGAGYAAGGDIRLGFGAAIVAVMVAYVRSVAKAAGAPSDFGGPMAKQQRMFAVIIATVYMGVTPAAWHFVWLPAQGWGVVSIALLLVIVGGVITIGRRLSRAAQSLRE
jgi:phosphatidylglycerophosphate synthase